MPKLLFVVTEDWYFYSHRLQLAIEARRKGFSVVVATRVHEHGERILAEGFKLIPIGMHRHSINPFRELSAILELVRIYKTESPDIVHHVALKPVVLGSVAALLSSVPKVVNAIVGMGFIFSSHSLKARILRPIIKSVLKALSNRSNTRTIFQNPDDRALMIQNGIVDKNRTDLIRGSGVDMQVYFPLPEPKGPLTVVLASRMLWAKGIAEFVEAARLLRKEHSDVRFVLVGESDCGNPAAVSAEQLAEFDRSGVVEWWGRHDDMPAVLASAQIVCLPSCYGEGVPKVLIEAAACGRPIVTTDWPGCREIVRHEENGLLVPVKNAVALADALRRLINNPSLRRDMQLRSRQIAVREFSSDKVISQTLGVYSDMFYTESNDSMYEQLNRASQV